MIGKRLCSSIAAAVLIAFGYPARYASISSDGRRALLLAAAISLAAHNSALVETQPCHSMEYDTAAHDPNRYRPISLCMSRRYETGTSALLTPP